MLEGQNPGNPSTQPGTTCDFPFDKTLCPGVLILAPVITSQSVIMLAVSFPSSDDKGSCQLLNVSTENIRQGNYRRSWQAQAGLWWQESDHFLLAFALSVSVSYLPFSS